MVGESFLFNPNNDFRQSFAFVTWLDMFENIFPLEFTRILPYHVEYKNG